MLGRTVDRKLAAVLLGLFALSLGTVGCGSSPDDDRPPTGRTVPIAVAELQDAFDSDDFAAICALMTPSAMRQAGNIGHGDPTACPRDVERVIAMIDKSDGWEGSSTPRVAASDGRGDRRVATVEVSDGWRAELPFAHQRGRWRLDGFFGMTPSRLKQAEAAARQMPFPSANGEPVTVVDDAGRPCTDVSTRRFPRLSGGCTIEVAGDRVPMRVLTGFGDFAFDRCSVRYTIRSDSQGRAWMDELEVDGPDEGGCGDVNQCVVPGTFTFQPWKGRLRADGPNRFVHRMSMCLRTCVGLFVGPLETRLVRDGDRWRVEPLPGSTGFRMYGPLESGRSTTEMRQAG